MAKNTTPGEPLASAISRADADMLMDLQRESLEYFLQERTPSHELIRDKTEKESPASISAIGFGLAALTVGVERNFVTRSEAIARTLKILRFFWQSPQNRQANATGYKGFFYHFLDMETGERAGDCELSTMDTSLFLAGALTAGMYFERDTADEQEIRRLADQLYRRVDWRWAQNRTARVTHGWKPERGFLKNRWEGYNESLLLYILGLGSPTHPLPPASYAAFISTARWKKIYDQEFIYAGPLFIYQFPHVWIDFRQIQDAFMREKGCDYFENSRRATLVQQQYAIRNPHQFAGDRECCWGITASDGPGPATLKIDGIKRRFYDYTARGVPFGPDDGTIAPWAAVASLPFAPEIVLPTIRHFHALKVKKSNPYGFKATFNMTFPSDSTNLCGWISPHHYGINQGPIILMIENFSSGLLWQLLRNCPYVQNGLRRAGFKGGWL